MKPSKFLMVFLLLNFFALQIHTFKEENHFSLN